MNAEALDKWFSPRRPPLDSLVLHRFLKPPYGYVIGIVLWPVFLSIISVLNVLWQSGLPSVLPSVVATVIGLVVVVGGSLVTILSSALVLSITAWNTPYERLRRQSVLLFLSLLLAVLLFGVYLTWPMFPYGYEVGLSVFVAHELSRVVFAGPAIGFTFMLFPLMVFASRYHHK